MPTSNESRMSMTVYIIGYDGDRWLPECLATLRGASRSRLDLVVIDNYRNPCLSGLDLSAFRSRVIKTPRRMGFADAHNYGVIAAPPQTELAVMLNQDTRSHDGWLDECAACFSSDSQLGILSPMTRTYENENWDAAFLECAQAAGNFDEAISEPGARARFSSGDFSSVPLVTGAAMMVRVRPMLKFGLFDPIFGSYYEDFDFCRRLVREGWKVGICPRAFIGHFSGSATTTPEAERKRMRLIVRNRIIEKIRQAGPRRGRAFLNHLVRHLPRNLARGVWGTTSSQPASVVLGGHWDLCPLLPRILSETRDWQAWRDYLDRAGWPDKQ